MNIDQALIHKTIAISSVEDIPHRKNLNSETLNSFIDEIIAKRKMNSITNS